MEYRVTLYTTNCPKCKVIELKLKQKNIIFEIIDDLDTIINFGNSVGINSAPILKVNDAIYNFNDAVKWINEVK